MQFIKNITSKDIELSKNTIKNMISSSNLDEFKLLAENSEFIFPFLKERISNDFVKLVNKSDLNTIFKFTKVYSVDFEDMIIDSFLKFANEELTDEILDLFENGQNSQKAYCALYFSKIKDTLALECLYKYANDEYEPLRINCARALKEFGDFKMLEIQKENILKSDDEFEKIKAFEYLSIFNEIEFIIENCFNSPFLANIISSLLDLNELDELKKVLSAEAIVRIFNAIIENYPENISLDTILYYQIYDFIKLISTYDNQYSRNALLIAKAKFNEFNNNEIYQFDLDKNTKNKLSEIAKLLNELNIETLQTSELEEYNNKTFKFETALNVIFEYNLQDYSSTLADLINNSKLNYNLIAKTAEVLKKCDKIALIDKTIIEKIEDINIKSLVLSYFN